MHSLIHRIKVFVCRRLSGGPEYLLLKGSRGIESFWVPVQGALGFGEKLEAAVRREVLDDTGLVRFQEVIDLEMPKRWLLGDEEVVEWSYGLRILPENRDVRLSEQWAEFRWAHFGDAYPRLEFEHDRAAIMRLHTLLAG